MNALFGDATTERGSGSAISRKRPDRLASFLLTESTEDAEDGCPGRAARTGAPVLSFHNPK
jgi:hypothetical protein